MPKITLPDGSIRQFDRPLTGLEVAPSIGQGLARDAVAIRLDDELRDLATRIERDVARAIVTRSEPAGLDLLRHDAAHVLAEAVKELYPETQVTIGPTIENGFYYDFARDEPFTPDDLERIEERMREIVCGSGPMYGRSRLAVNLRQWTVRTVLGVAAEHGLLARPGRALTLWTAYGGVPEQWERFITDGGGTRLRDCLETADDDTWRQGFMAVESRRLDDTEERFDNRAWTTLKPELRRVVLGGWRSYERIWSW